MSGITGVDRVSSGKDTVGFENRYKCKDGSYKTLSWSASADPKTGMIYAAARDVTSLRKQIAIETIISDLRARYMKYKNDSWKLFDFVLSKVINITESEYGFIGEIVFDDIKKTNYLKTFALTNIAWNDETRILFNQFSKVGFEFRNLNTLFGEVVKTGQDLITNTPSNHPAKGGLPNGHPPLKAFWGVPIYKGSQFIGVIGLANKTGGYAESQIHEFRSIFDTVGEIMYAFRIERETTESQNKLDIALKEAQEATRAKSDFLATMSHEIRTPLNGVIGLSEILLDSNLPPAQLEIAHTISNSGKTLLSIINDILDFSKIEAGKLEIESIEFDLATYIEELVKPYMFTAEKKNLKFETSIAKIKNNLVGDPGRIGQIINNLLSNAFKFTTNGSIKLNVTNKIEGDLTSITLNVSDTGIGIPEDAKKNMFQAFGQAEQSTSRKYGGTGLGLSICKKIVQMMNGDISYTSQEGAGTTFTVTFKLKNSKELTNSIQSNVKENKEESNILLKGRVLVAEDNQTNQMVIGRILETLGLQYHFVANGFEALKAIEASKFDLILMDCQMPEMDGYSATRAIRENKNTNCHMPIIALTANAIQGEEQKCIEAGMNGYVTKPINRNNLRNVLLNFLQQR